MKLVGRRPLRIEFADRIATLVEHATPPGEFAFDLDGQRIAGHRYDAGDQVFVRIAGRTYALPRASKGASKAQRDELRADMPGTVVAVHVAPGQRVAAGDPLVTVESMKLQVVVAADRDAIVVTTVAAQATFERGAILVTVKEPA